MYKFKPILFSIIAFISLAFGVGFFHCSSFAQSYDINLNGSPVVFSDDFEFSSFASYSISSEHYFLAASTSQYSGRISFSCGSLSSYVVYISSCYNSDGVLYYIYRSPMLNISSFGSLPVYSSLNDAKSDIDSWFQCSDFILGDFTFTNYRLISSRSSSNLGIANLYFYCSPLLSDGSTNVSFKYALVSSDTDVNSISFSEFNDSGTCLTIPIIFPNSLTELYVFPVNDSGLIGTGVHFTIPDSWEDLSLNGSKVSGDNFSFSTYESTEVSTSTVKFDALSDILSTLNTYISNLESATSVLTSSEITDIGSALISSGSSDVTDSDFSLADYIDSPYDYNIYSDSQSIIITDFSDSGLVSDVQGLNDGISDSISDDIYHPYFTFFDDFDFFPLYIAIPSVVALVLVIKLFFRW